MIGMILLVVVVAAFTAAAVYAVTLYRCDRTLRGQPKLSLSDLPAGVYQIIFRIEHLEGWRHLVVERTDSGIEEDFYFVFSYFCPEPIFQVRSDGWVSTPEGFKALSNVP